MKTLTLAQICDRLQYSPRTVYAYRKSGAHPGIVEVTGPGHPRFRLDALEAWEAGGYRSPKRRPHLSAHKQIGTSLHLARRVG